MDNHINLKDGDQCDVVAGTHAGKAGVVKDINKSKTGHITITVVQKDGVRFKTLAKNVVVKQKGKKTLTDYEQAADLYQNLVSGNSEVELKGKSLPYTSYKGNMFSALYQDGTIGLRLPDEQRKAFIKKHKTSQPIQHGVVLKEYVIVPIDLLKKPKLMKGYFDKSFAYVKTLKPKK